MAAFACARVPLRCVVAAWCDHAGYADDGRVLYGRRRSSLVRYELFGVVEHSGTYRDGHYTAFVRVSGSRAASASQNGERKDGVWNLFSDSKVSAVSEQQVLDAQAFLLFYARVKP
jgi:ubiquitin C-terminal hydrolase